MARENENQRSTLTLRDVALAALELDASGGRDSVSWSDVIAKAKVVAAERGAAIEPQPAGISP